MVVFGELCLVIGEVGLVVVGEVGCVVVIGKLYVVVREGCVR